MDGTVAVVVVELAQAAETDAAPRDANQVEAYSNKTDVRVFFWLESCQPVPRFFFPLDCLWSARAFSLDPVLKDPRVFGPNEERSRCDIYWLKRICTLKRQLAKCKGQRHMFFQGGAPLKRTGSVRRQR